MKCTEKRLYVVVRSHMLEYIFYKFCSFSDVEELALGIENIPLRSDTARVLLSLLEVPIAPAGEVPSNFHSLCQLWFSSGHDCSLEVLVRVLLCTPSLGYLVTGLTSICELAVRETASLQLTVLVHET